MKTTIFLLHIIGGLLLFSCAKDKSNYDYTDGELITIEGIRDSYSLISQKDTLKLTPTARSNKEGEFEYRWGIYETNVQGRIEPLDTIGRTKDLNYYVREDAKDWVLVFMVRNKKTGYTQYKNSTLTVNTQFTRGWYVLKDDGTQSDLDLFLTPASAKAEEKVEDVFSLVNGKKIDGKATSLSFFSAYKSTVTGTLGNTRAIMISTEQDIQAINLNTLKTIRNKEDIFLGGAQDVGPASAVFIASTANHVLNKGQLYNINAFSPNSGQFGNRIMIDANNSTYELSKFFCTSTNADPILFDNISSSFVTQANGSGSILTNFSTPANAPVPVKNNNKTALYMGYKNSVYLPSPSSYYLVKGYGVFQDKTNPSLKTISYLEQDKLVLKITNDTITSSRQIFNAIHYSLLTEDENLLYFANRNQQIYSYNLSNKFEQLQYALPAGEEVTFIRHLKYTNSADVAFNFNFVIIGSKIGSNYKIRMFKKNSGNLESTPFQTLEGKGSPKNILYISPRVAENTYPNS